MKFIFLFLSFIFSSRGWAYNWPDAPWLNNPPRNDVPVSVVAFVSPFDLQFYHVMGVWKKFEKRYSNFPVEFIIVVKSEQNLTFDDEFIRGLLKENNYSLPVFLDFKSNYSKMWHAYATPTINLIFKRDQVINFEGGSFDFFAVEKSLQKALKDSGIANLPSREYPSEGETKSCGHTHTVFLGEKFQKVWGSEPVTVRKGWTAKPFWIEKSSKEPAAVEVPANKNNVGFLGEATGKASVRVNVLLDEGKIPWEFRGKDILEDKSGTYFLAHTLKIYDILTHGNRLKDNSQKLNFIIEGSNFKLRGIELVPTCLEGAP